MDTSGRAPEMILKFSRSLRISTKIDNLKMSFRTSILLLIVVLICGCSSKLMLGKPPLTDRLNQFTVNVTTLDDIKTALGEPQGHGAARLFGPRLPGVEPPATTRHAPDRGTSRAPGIAGEGQAPGH